MHPLVSVVVPCRNEVKHISRCLDSILSSSYPNIEVLVIDGQSTDGTLEVLETYAQKVKTIFVYTNTHRLTPYAFNIGVRHAKGDYVLRVDARNTIAKSYIYDLIEALQEQPDLGAAGGDYQHLGESPQGTIIARVMESPFGVGGSNYRTQKSDADVDTVGVTIYKRKVFETVGLYDESLTRNQDDEFNYRVRKAGFRIRYVHRAKTTYFVRDSLYKAFRQFFQYGYFKVFVNRKHQTLTTLRQLAPPLFVAGLFIGFALSFFHVVFAMLYIGTLSFYLAAGLKASRATSENYTDRLMFVWTAFLIHLGYGLGYWRGLWDFRILGRSPDPSLEAQTT